MNKSFKWWKFRVKLIKFKVRQDFFQAMLNKHYIMRMIDLQFIGTNINVHEVNGQEGLWSN